MQLLPNVTPAMLNPAFWLALLDAPDAPLLDAAEIADFNTHAHSILDIPQVPDLPDRPDAMDAAVLRAALPPLPDVPYYDLKGTPLPAKTWDALEANIARDALPNGDAARLGLTVRRTSVRRYPTACPGLREPGDFYFDRWQETTIDVGTPVAVVHSSADGDWRFALTPFLWGWVWAADIALTERPATVQSYVNAESFMVATAPRTGITLPGGTMVSAQMGTRLPLVGRDGKVARLLVPQRDAKGQLRLVEGYVTTRYPGWHVGYMPCTLRTLFTQAFALLGERYCWGGLRAGVFGRDCSRFVRDVYAVAGLCLPRNSGQQGLVGVNAARFRAGETAPDRLATLAAHVRPGALVILPGHVMLYLGAAAGGHYVIHDVWGYTHPDGHRTHIGAVAVTDLPAAPTGSLSYTMRLTHAQAPGIA